MKAVFAAFLILFAVPAWAGELSDYLDSLPPLPPEVRESFTRAMMSAYNPECRCALFMREGKIWEADIPLSDKSMRILIEMLKRGTITPLVSGNST